MMDLLLIHIHGHQYAVRKNEVAAVRDLEDLHRIPLAPRGVAGIAMVEGRTVTVADLPVCMGHGAAAGSRGNFRVLILSGSEQGAGFLVAGDVDCIAVGDEDIQVMPDYLKTDLISSCAVRDSDLFPIINISLLHRQLLKGGTEASFPSFVLPHDASGSEISSEARLFRLGSLVYAADSALLKARSVRPGKTATLSGLPRYIKGIASGPEGILPVIDLGQRVHHQEAGQDREMIVGMVGEKPFGFLVDEDRGALQPCEMTFADLPAIVRVPWLTAALLHRGDIIPFIDLPKLLSSARDSHQHDTSLSERYTPASEFPGSFGQKDVPVLEFSLLGARHALPKCEVEDVIAFKKFRVMPRTPEIVVGVAELDGALLPVIDLAMVFGRRSTVAPGWSMIIVKNGDFRGLVITETVFGERLLPADVQRELPILVPHEVVYGCYPDASGVRLILNVEAMAVHFEKSLVRDLLPALSPEMKQAAPGIVPSLLHHEEKTASSPGIPEQEQATVTVETASVPPSSAPVEQNPDEVQPRNKSGEADDQNREKARAAAEPSPVSGTGEEPASSLTQEEQSHIVADPHAESYEKAEIPSEPAGHESASVPVETIDKEVHQEEEVRQPERKDLGDVNPATAASDLREDALEEPSTPVQISPESREEVAAPVEQPKRESRFEKSAEPVTVISDRNASDATAGRPWKGKAAAAVAAAVVAAIIYLYGTSNRPVTENTVKETATVEVKPVKSQTKADTKAEKAEPPLVLEIPAERPVGIDVYTVVKDDTLWSISERFTGNPFNYPRIAGENRIANPDMIFPGQKIRLKKKP